MAGGLEKFGRACNQTGLGKAQNGSSWEQRSGKGVGGVVRETEAIREILCIFLTMADSF